MEALVEAPEDRGGIHDGVCVAAVGTAWRGGPQVFAGRSGLLQVSAAEREISIICRGSSWSNKISLVP